MRTRPRLLRVALAALAAAGLAIATARGGDDGGATPPRRPDGGTPDAGGRDGDEELIRHLEEVEKLDLLMNLELFDEKDD